MGYDLHITRRKNWTDTTSNPITKIEWLALATADPALRPLPENGDTFFQLTTTGWFDLADGNLTTKNPDPPTLAKAHLLAAHLQAKVQGDDGETYLPNGETIDPNTTTNLDDRRIVKVYPFWLLALCLFSISCFLVVLMHILTK